MFVVVILILAAAFFRVETYAESESVYRLPDHTIPKSYDLKIVANLDGEFNFSGEVIIDIFVKAPTSEILLHAKDLNIVDVKLYGDGAILSPRYSLNAEILILTADSDLKENTDYRLRVKYEGLLNDDMVGFYRSYYRVGNRKKWLAVTQFAPMYARMAFPCYDEPNFKTPFNISVARYPKQKAISNMPLRNTSDPDSSTDNRVWDSFHTTPPMSTYLVAFIVCELSHVTDAQGEFFVWAREEAVQDGVFAVQEGQNILKQLETFVGTPYPLPRLNLVAVPDLKFGGMENYGLITCREENLLYNKEISSERDLEDVTMAVAHELAHQWFGDYVTPKWWDYSWLNEAFATYFQFSATAQIEPDWRLNESFVVHALQSAMFVDEAYLHHAMTSSKNTSDDIKEQFDRIIYDKGASVLRMLENIVTSPTFKNALKLYLNESFENGNGSVTPDDLWNAFDKQAYIDKINLPPMTTIKSIMKLWTENRGYPLLTVTVTRGNDTGNVTIEQRSYNTVRSIELTPTQQWIIPLSYATKSSMNYEKTNPSVWLFPDEKQTLKTTLQNDEWILFNLQQIGYFRVNYDEENWRLLTEQLFTEPERVHVLNRAQLIDDSLSLAIDGILPYSIPLKLATYLDHETDAIPWLAAVNKLQYLRTQFEATSIGAQLKDFILERVKKQYKRLGFHSNPNDDHLTKIGRSTVVAMACRLDLWDCVESAQKEYMKNVKDLSNVDPNVKETVFCTILKTLNVVSVWNKLWSLYQKSNVAHEQKTVLFSLGCIENEQFLKKYLYKFINPNDTDIRDQYMAPVFKRVFSTQKGVTAGLNLINDLLSDISKFDSNTIETLTSMLTLVKSEIKSETQIKILEKMILDAEKLDKGIYKSLTNALDTAYRLGILQVEEAKKRVEEVENAILSNTESTTSTTPPPSPTKNPINDTTTSAPATEEPSSAGTRFELSIFVYIFLIAKTFVLQ